MAPGITLVLGGARSGKSELAEELVAGQARDTGLPVTYVATAAAAPGDDPDWSARVAAHRARRPGSWTTVEVGAGGSIVGALTATAGIVLLDSLGVWVAGTPMRGGRFLPETDALCEALQTRIDRLGPTVVVSDEVGLGVHPSTEAGRAYRDALGEVNRAVADVAGRVLLVVAGRILELPPPAGMSVRAVRTEP